MALPEVFAQLTLVKNCFKAVDCIVLHSIRTLPLRMQNNVIQALHRNRMKFESLRAETSDLGGDLQVITARNGSK